MNPAQFESRISAPGGTLALMEHALNEYVHGLIHNDSPVNPCRAAVREACISAATKNPGFFSLTVPTGGGKTLSSLAFALRHAQLFDLNRIIYVVPFTTIIEQNAEEFRRVMNLVPGIENDRLVIEHHSNFDPDKENAHSRLACENWNAPLIVTTSVQFYESLFGKKTSACRKLHNLARAVIILDEAQTIPVDYLRPILSALDELVLNYGSTVVLCTATQPAVNKRLDFPIGIENVREIIPEPKRLYLSLNRVNVENLGLRTDDDLVSLLRKEERVLCIVNTRGHARTLIEALGIEEGHYHLSALMCPAHRSQKLAEIRRRLEAGLRCRVVSTQLIEAGVDVDFPVVFRSMAGLDAIAQAAGRCNRNGRLAQKGQVFIFTSEHQDREHFLADTANCAAQVLELKAGDILDLETIDQYFKLYYWDQTARWDRQTVMRSFNLVQDKDFPFLFDFSRVARDFRIISENTRPVIVPWGNYGVELCETLRILPALNRDILRKLQRFSVQISARTWMAQLRRTITPVHEGSLAILMSLKQYYSDTFGLHIDDPLGDAIFV